MGHLLAGIFFNDFTSNVNFPARPVKKVSKLKKKKSYLRLARYMIQVHRQAENLMK